MACPYLKEVVMLYCDAYPVKKMLPLDRIATADPCLGEFHCCPVFREGLVHLRAAAATTTPTEPDSSGNRTLSPDRPR
jgi:hypothetical protein